MPSEFLKNHVISALRPEAQEFIAQHAQVRPLETGAVLHEERDTFTHAIFPHSGILSLMTEMADGRSVEKTSIGREGFVGFTYLLGNTGAISKTVVQVPGYASWLAIEHLDEAMDRFVCIRDAMLYYSKSLIVQLMETVACNALHTAENRVSRWLLHADDRMGAKDFQLTQESLSMALGMRRATVSEISSALMRSGAISYSRGVVSVLDRSILRSHACECYDKIARADMRHVQLPRPPTWEVE